MVRGTHTHTHTLSPLCFDNIHKCPELDLWPSEAAAKICPSKATWPWILQADEERLQAAARADRLGTGRGNALRSHLTQHVRVATTARAPNATAAPSLTGAFRMLLGPLPALQPGDLSPGAGLVLNGGNIQLPCPGKVPSPQRQLCSK